MNISFGAVGSGVCSLSNKVEDNFLDATFPV